MDYIEGKKFIKTLTLLFIGKSIISKIKKEYLFKSSFKFLYLSKNDDICRRKNSFKNFQNRAMKISNNWLKDYIKTELKLKE
jgi:phenylalanyl-tRNA synthetase beta chain